MSRCDGEPSPVTNPIYLSNKIFRRDQIKFVEKDKDTFESTIYSLADFGSTDVWNDQNYLLNYFKGKYGTLPYIDFSRLFARAGREHSSLLAHASRTHGEQLFEEKRPAGETEEEE